MKKLIPLLLLAVLIPQVAFASWWNPFSWNLIKRHDKTQVLEDRVKELEKKLEEVSTQTSSTTTPVSSSPAADTKKLSHQPLFKLNRILIFLRCLLRPF